MTWIAGVGITEFRKRVRRKLKDSALEAAHEAVVDAGLSPSAVDGIVFANALAGPITGQELIRGQVVFAGTPFEGIPIINVENACASGGTGLHVGRLAVESGAYGTVLVVGAEKMSHQDKNQTFEALNSGIDVSQEQALHDRYDTDDSGGALMMDIYGGIAKDYMHTSGATSDDLADVVVKNRKHAASNPIAHFRTQTSRGEVLASRRISGPLTLFMCSPISDGAAAILLSAARPTSSPAVRFRASSIATPSTIESGLSPSQAAAESAYAAAGIEPRDIDVLEVHDACAVAELIAYEDLQLCKRGEGPAFLRSGASDLQGEYPTNAGGGLLGRGHPVGATGCAQLVELTLQVRGKAGGRQVAGPKCGVAENHGGYIDPHPAVAAVSVLTAE